MNLMIDNEHVLTDVPAEKVFWFLMGYLAAASNTREVTRISMEDSGWSYNVIYTGESYNLIAFYIGEIREECSSFGLENLASVCAMLTGYCPQCYREEVKYGN